MRRVLLLLPPFALTLALAIGLLLPGLAQGATAGSGPPDAIAVVGAPTGSLAPGQTRWYSVTSDGSSPLGVVMEYNPPTFLNSSAVFFNVDWTTPVGNANADWPGYFRIGQGTESGLGDGHRYWFNSSPAATTYYFQLVNNSSQPVGYALARTGSAFPPPRLNPPAPGAQTIVTVPPTPTAIPTAGPAPVPANTATDRSGLVLAPKVVAEGPFSSVLVNVSSSSPQAVVVGQVLIRPPAGAVVDAVRPINSLNLGGVAWFTNTLVSQGSPMSGYETRFYGSANGTLVQINWSTSGDKGVLSVTIQGAPPPPAPVGA
ncbi:MAG TPA: hypothetical protein VFZ25_05370 [Chloroflexota bacterium]|nr:hypothetical protein [Chloroflexota bacterium]